MCFGLDLLLREAWQLFNWFPNLNLILLAKFDPKGVQLTIFYENHKNHPAAGNSTPRSSTVIRVIAADYSQRCPIETLFNK